MGTILGDLFKHVGGGIGKVLDGDIIDGVADVLGGVGNAGERAVNSALNLVGLGDDEDHDSMHWLEICEIAALAKMAKCDGRVSQPEIEFLNSVLDAMGYEGETKKRLQEFANEQRKDVSDILNFITEVARCAAKLSPDDKGVELRAVFYKTLFMMALADGDLADKEIALLRAIPDSLGFEDDIFDVMVDEFLENAENDDESERTANDASDLAEAYSMLGVSPDVSDFEVRQAYMKKIAVFHPDKIQGKDLDPAWTELANQQSAKINKAYESIKSKRGMKR